MELRGQGEGLSAGTRTAGRLGCPYFLRLPLSCGGFCRCCGRLGSRRCLGCWSFFGRHGFGRHGFGCGFCHLGGYLGSRVGVDGRGCSGRRSLVCRVDWRFGGGGRWHFAGANRAFGGLGRSPASHGTEWQQSRQRSCDATRGHRFGLHDVRTPRPEHRHGSRLDRKRLAESTR